MLCRNIIARSLRQKDEDPANKEALDEVVNVLKEIEETLGIVINYVFKNLFRNRTCFSRNMCELI